MKSKKGVILALNEIKMISVFVRPHAVFEKKEGGNMLNKNRYPKNYGNLSRRKK
jgi:hypothetical protein